MIFMNTIAEKILEATEKGGNAPTHILVTNATLEGIKKTIQPFSTIRLDLPSSIMGLKIILINDGDLYSCSPRVRQSLEEGILLLRWPGGL